MGNCTHCWMSGYSHPKYHHHYCICEAARTTTPEYILDHPDLAIVDVLARAASGPLLIEHRIAEYCHLWKFDFNGNPKLLHLKSVFGFFSSYLAYQSRCYFLRKTTRNIFSIQASFSQETGIYNCDHFHLADDCSHTSTRTAASSKRLKLLYFIFFVLRYSTLCNFVFLY